MTVLITGSTVQYVEKSRIKKHTLLQTIGLMDMKAVTGIIRVQEHALADIRMFTTSHIPKCIPQIHIHITSANTGCNVLNAAMPLN